MYRVPDTYIIENEKGVFKVDVWNDGKYNAIAQQLLVKEYRTSRGEGSNNQVAAYKAVEKLIEEYNI